MVDGSVLNAVKRYLAALPSVGIHPSRAVLFGSHARGSPHQWSDIDVVVIAPEFDTVFDRRLLENLWVATGEADNRIEPVPCGEREWETEEGRPILTIARLEGMVIPA